MSISDGFLEYILELLQPIEGISTSSMFGGVLLKVGKTQLGILADDVMYLKVTDADLQKKYAAEGSEQFSYTRKDKPKPVTIKNWWSAPASAMDSQTEMVTLANEVLSQPPIKKTSKQAAK